MATYSAWWKGFCKKPEVRPVTWLCGPERILVEDVLATIRQVLQPAPWNYVPLVAGEDSEREIWSEVFAVPQGSTQTRLVVVRNAERLKAPERLLMFLRRGDAHPGTYLVLVSSETTVPRKEPDEDQRRRGAKGDVVDHLAALSGKGHIVECRPFTIDTAQVAVDWVMSRIKIRRAVAGHLLNRADGNMRLVRDVCQKLAVFPGEPTIAAVNDLLSAQPRDTFVDALVAMDKKGALAALERIQPEEYSRTLGMLDSHLDLAGMIHDMQVEHRSAYDIAKKAGNKNFLVKDLLPVARHYDHRRRLLIRSTLVVADDALRAGARVGVMEAVVALW